MMDLTSIISSNFHQMESNYDGLKTSRPGQDLRNMRNNCKKKCNIDITRYGIFNITGITYDEKKIIAIIKNKFFDFHAASTFYFLFSILNLSIYGF